MELQEALTQISEIRAQIARTEVFRGYRAAAVALSGFAALAAAAVQAIWIPRPLESLGAYLGLWCGAAGLGLAAAGVGMVLKLRESGSPLHRRAALLAIELFVPCVAAGALVTAAIYRSAPGACALLPGLWSVIFGLGMFASHRLLPRPILSIAAYYMLVGAWLLTLGDEGRALAPWTMALSFGLGQLGVAAVLYWTLERESGGKHAEQA